MDAAGKLDPKPWIDLQQMDKVRMNGALAYVYPSRYLIYPLIVRNVEGDDRILVDEFISSFPAEADRILSSLFIYIHQ